MKKTIISAFGVPLLFMILLLMMLAMTTDSGSNSRVSASGCTNQTVQQLNADDITVTDSGLVDKNGNSLCDTSAGANKPNPNAYLIDDGACKGYPIYQCTWWACSRRAELGFETGSSWGNGGAWASSARQAGFIVDHTPEVGAAFSYYNHGAVYRGSTAYGHVAVVEEVLKDGRARITEYSGGEENSFDDTRLIDKSWYEQSDSWFIHSKGVDDEKDSK
jgi:surface antigen